MTNLENKTCTACHGSESTLNESQIGTFMKELKGGWSRNQKGHLEKAYPFKNFADAMGFANKITDIAEAQGHHPDLHITWGKCDVEIWTHFLNGLTESDFYLAAKIEKLLKH